jgi:5-formyltetrahydrofolate cyclo-ligase
VREREYMDKKNIFNPEDMKEELKEQMKKVRENMPFKGEHHRQHRHMQRASEVKLFTDKSAMVEYVNNLSEIENVEIFKIEDALYKVLITRRVKQGDCCKEQSE